MEQITLKLLSSHRLLFLKLSHMMNVGILDFAGPAQCVTAHGLFGSPVFSWPISRCSGLTIGSHPSSLHSAWLHFQQVSRMCSAWPSEPAYSCWLRAASTGFSDSSVSGQSARTWVWSGTQDVCGLTFMLPWGSKPLRASSAYWPEIQQTWVPILPLLLA